MINQGRRAFVLLLFVTKNLLELLIWQLMIFTCFDKLILNFGKMMKLYCLSHNNKPSFSSRIEFVATKELHEELETKPNAGWAIEATVTDEEAGTEGANVCIAGGVNNFNKEQKNQKFFYSI